MLSLRSPLPLALLLVAACSAPATDGTLGPPRQHLGNGTSGGTAGGSNDGTSGSGANGAASANGGGTTGQGQGQGQGQGTNGGGAPFVVASHPPMPQMVTSGGPVMASPKVVPIFFSADALQTQIMTYLTGLGATDYWSANTKEYGVGAIAAASPVVATQAAPTTVTDAQIQSFIAGLIAGGQVPAPTLTSTLYTVFYPTTTTITLGQDTSCQVFGGYHSEAQVNGQHFVYAVIPRCSNFNGLSLQDMVTVAASHELIEASTDPLVQTQPAYQQPDDDHAIWGVVLTSEAGDMCAQNPNVQVKPPGFDFMVQKSWSNKAALASHDPCAPNLPGEVYFNAAPALNDPITITFNGATIASKGVKVPKGQSKTIDVTLYSDAPTSGPWQVKAVDFQTLVGGTTTYLTFTQDKTQGQNGDHIQLTVTSTGVDPTLGVEPFFILSKLGTQETWWVGAVSN